MQFFTLGFCLWERGDLNFQSKLFTRQHAGCPHHLLIRILWKGNSKGNSLFLNILFPRKYCHITSLFIYLIQQIKQFHMPGTGLVACSISQKKKSSPKETVGTLKWGIWKSVIKELFLKVWADCKEKNQTKRQSKTCKNRASEHLDLEVWWSGLR